MTIEEIAETNLTKEELDARDKALIELLKQNPKGLKISQVCALLPTHFQRHTAISSHGNLCPAFYKSVDRINQNWDYQLAIVKVDDEIWKIGNEEEIKNRMEKHYKQALGYLTKYSYLKKKKIILDPNYGKTISLFDLNEGK